jgi:hypothetical protein
MEESEVESRIRALFEEMTNRETRKSARLKGDENSWSRQRDMPLHDILACTLGKKGLSTAMEVRQYFQGIGKEEQMVSKQAYLQQRQKLNPEVFRILAENYLKRFYGGKEARLWNGYLVCTVDGSRRIKVRRRYSELS